MIHQELQSDSCEAPESGTQRSAIETVLDEYLRLKNESLGGQMEIVGPLLDDWIDNRTEVAKTNRLHGSSFNPLSHLKIDETAHSRILGDLLDPDGTHGQGNVFLVPFLDELGVPESGSGLWRVTVETGRVDILVWRNHPEKCAVIIENKSNGAGDRPNQIYRYWHQEMFLWDPALWTSKDPAIISEQKRRFHVVYLPTDGGKSPQSHSMERPLGFENVNPFPRVPLKCRILPLADLMALWEEKSVPEIHPGNHRLRTFVSQYQELWTK